MSPVTSGDSCLSMQFNNLFPIFDDICNFFSFCFVLACLQIRVTSSRVFFFQTELYWPAFLPRKNILQLWFIMLF